jgi:hypothetical protein
MEALEAENLELMIDKAKARARDMMKASLALLRQVKSATDYPAHK